MAYALVDEPEKVKAAFFQIAEALRMLIRDQYKTTISFFGGRSIGFYHIWAPGSVIWYSGRSGFPDVSGALSGVSVSDIGELLRIMSIRWYISSSQLFASGRDSAGG